MTSIRGKVVLHCGDEAWFTASHMPFENDRIWCTRHQIYATVIDSPRGKALYRVKCRRACTFGRRDTNIEYIIAAAKKHVNNTHHAVLILDAYTGAAMAKVSDKNVVGFQLDIDQANV